MGLETATYISQLVATNPLGTDPKSQGDNHIQLIKGVLQTQFPNFGAAAMNATVAELNYSVGLTGLIQTQIDGKVTALNAALTGIPTAPTASPGTSTTQIATTAFAAALAFSSALPAQAGNAGKYITTDGTTASWVALSTIPSVIRDARTGNTILAAGDKFEWIDVTSGTFTQTADTAANLGAGWSVELANSGTGVVTYAGLAIYQGQRYRLQSDGTTIRTTPLGDQGVIIVRDEKAATTQGGTATSGSWFTRTLNTTAQNTISGASLSADMVVLSVPGVYVYEASVPANQVEQHQCRIYNVTTSAVLNIGTTEYCGAGAANNTRSIVRGQIATTVSTALRLEHRVQSTKATDGLGSGLSNFGVNNVFSELIIRKVG